MKKLVALVESLPAAVVSPQGLGHLGFKVGKKTFGWYLNNHHGDGIYCVCCKSTLARQKQLVAADPVQYLVPAYVGHQGWVSLRLDLPNVDWDGVTELVIAAYRLQAPRKLLAEID